MTDEDRLHSLWRIVLVAGQRPSEDGWAAAVARGCAAVLPSIDSVAITLRTRTAGPEELFGASDPWAARLDEAQFTMGEGPGADAHRLGSPVFVPDLVGDSARWPAFSDAALSDGAAAIFAFPLHTGAIKLGTLTLYRCRTGGLPRPESADAAVLADYVTHAVLADMALVQLAGGQWAPPNESYHQVSIATGMLAARLHITLPQAFARLQARAFAEGRSLRQVADDVVAWRTELSQWTE